jgi:hypothetical protein
MDSDIADSGIRLVGNNLELGPKLIYTWNIVSLLGASKGSLELA